MQQIGISTNHFVLCQQLSDGQGKRTKAPISSVHQANSWRWQTWGKTSTPKMLWLFEAKIEHLFSWWWRETWLDYISHHAKCKNMIDSFSNFIFIKIDLWLCSKGKKNTVWNCLVLFKRTQSKWLSISIQNTEWNFHTGVAAWIVLTVL